MYDFIIIGSGTSGLSAAMYASRLNLKTLIVGEMPGGLITTTHIVENWPGILSISGPDLGMAIFDHAKKSGAEFKNEKVLSVSLKDVKDSDKTSSKNSLYTVKTASNSYDGKAVLFATGTHHKTLEAKGMKEFENKGVSYCALCDGAFYKGKNVCIVGGGDSAAKEAIFLSQVAAKVYIIVRRDILRAEPRNQELIANSKNIEILFNTEIKEVLPDESGEKVGKIIIKTGKDSATAKDSPTTKELPMDGVFLAIGHEAQTDLAKELGIELNEKGEIKINRHSETNLPGVYAAGDCADTEFKQAITGSAEGVTAAYYAFKYVKG